MVALAEALEVLYPTAKPLVDWVVTDDGTGPRLTFWSPALGPEPTPAQLAAVTDQQVTDARRAKEPFLRDLIDDATARIAQIDTYLAIASPTNAQVAAEFRRSEIAERRIIQALARLIVREWRS